MRSVDRKHKGKSVFGDLQLFGYEADTDSKVKLVRTGYVALFL